MAFGKEQQAPIAIVGMGCRYPGKVNSPEALWKFVSEGRDAFSEVPEDRFNLKAFYHPDLQQPGTIQSKGGHFLDQDFADFDAGFFGIPPREAELVDPQQRLVLEASWEAVENTGLTMDEFKGSNTSVFGTLLPPNPRRPWVANRESRCLIAAVLMVQSLCSVMTLNICWLKTL